MMFPPSQLFLSWMFGLIAFAVLAMGLYLLYQALKRPAVILVDRTNATLATGGKASGEAHARRKRTALIAIALLLLLWAFAGRHVVSLMRPAGSDEPQDAQASTVKRIKGASGAELRVEEWGPADAPAIVLTHGWGADSRQWRYARRHLAERFHVIAWDLPGLGDSTAMPDGDYSLDKMAADLHTVVSLAGGHSAVLVGHSIGGMLNLTFCRLYPQELGKRIAGIVQLNTTYTNPIKTTKHHEFSQAVQKPVYEPLLHFTAWLSPVVRAMGWLSYQSGLAHLQNASQSFAGAETRGQLDFVSTYHYRSSPAVVARGVLAMLQWDASDVLPRIDVPVLIVSGEQDTTTIPAASEHMQRSIPRAERVTVTPAAHLGPIEQSARYENAMLEFATERLLGGASRERQASANAK